MMRLFLLLALVALAGAASAQEVRFPAAAVPDHAGPATIKASIYKPAGDGPFPAVIVLHGCGGPDFHHTSWAQTLVGWGYVALVPDSFSSRGEASICTKVLRIPPPVRVVDVIAAADYLADQPFVAKGRIGVLGFSHGGWTIMKGVQANAGWSAHGIKGSVAYYPYCDPQADRDIALPLLVLMGDKDDWTPAARCKALFASGIKQPDLVDAVYYPDAYHAFDRRGATGSVMGLGEDGVISRRRLEYDVRATRDAEERTQAFFARLLR
jgi:dienelactone hydrolase